MSRLRLPLSAVAIAAIVVSGLSVTAGGSSAAAPSAFCPKAEAHPYTLIRWTGNAGTTDWETAGNWHPQVVPDQFTKVASYQPQYVCIGLDSDGKPANVEIPKEWHHIAGIDIGLGARLIDNQGRLFVGGSGKPGHPVVPSFVRANSQLQILAGALGGNGPLTVDGKLRMTAIVRGSNKFAATQTSSECAFQPSRPECPGATKPGGGRTIIAKSGRMLVDGIRYGGVNLEDHRVIVNFGTIRFTNVGYLAMDKHTHLVDRPQSLLEFDGTGGIYQGVGTHFPSNTIREQGSLVNAGSGATIIGVPVKFGTKPNVKVTHGTLSTQSQNTPIAHVAKGGAFGSGTCDYVPQAHASRGATGTPCAQADATSHESQVAILGLGRQKSRFRRVAVTVENGGSATARPASASGSAMLGHPVDVTASAVKGAGPTRLTLKYDATLNPPSHVKIRRGTHHSNVSMCSAHPLSKTTHSCVVSEVVPKAGSGEATGDLIVTIKTVSPASRWRAVYVQHIPGARPRR